MARHLSGDILERIGGFLSPLDLSIEFFYTATDLELYWPVLMDEAFARSIQQVESWSEAHGLPKRRRFQKIDQSRWWVLTTLTQTDLL